MKRLQENDVMKKEVEKASDGIAKNFKCESCEENPTKLYSIPSAKWYCYCQGKVLPIVCNSCRVYGHRRNLPLLVLSDGAQEDGELRGALQGSEEND